MSATLAARRQSATTPVRPSVVRTQIVPLVDACPFQPYAKLGRNVHALKPSGIEAMADWWAATDLPTPNDAFAAALQAHPQWFDSYTLISAFDRSLMLPGHQNLVMHLVEDPTQIPDRPPTSIIERLLVAERMYPTAKIYYAEPVFAVSSDPSKLPVPMTENAFLCEAGQRILKAQALAKRWAWYYWAVRCAKALDSKYDAWCKSHEIARIKAEMEGIERLTKDVSEITARHGEGMGRTITPPEMMRLMEFERRLLVRRLKSSTPDTVLSLSMEAQLDIIMRRIDPLLLLELPEEPGKLRLIGHWFWHKTNGKECLHLHLMD